MIQELFGGGNNATGLVGGRKIPIPYSSSSPPTCHATSSPLLTTTTTITSTNLVNSPSTNGGNNKNPETTNTNTNTNTSKNSENNNNNGNQNLRCPRCDSTNTKFCYYNNYNLTQPRHFCKTCRRYWTKGGTLRNVPIGGGCRKNKSTISTNSSANMLSKSSTNVMAKAKASLSSEMLALDNSLFLGNGLLEYHPFQPTGPSGQILGPSQNSHILALLRGSSPFANPNPNPSPNPTSTMFTNLGLDSYVTDNGAPSLLGSLPRSNQHNLNGFSPDFAHNNGDNHNSSSTNTTSNILDLYQRLKSSTNYGYCSNENQGAVILGNMVGSSSSMSSSSLDATTPSGGSGGGSFEGYGFMSSSPAISNWSEFPAVSINNTFS